MLLVVDVGNTNITLGVFDGEEQRDISNDNETSSYI